MVVGRRSGVVVVVLSRCGDRKDAREEEVCEGRAKGRGARKGKRAAFRRRRKVQAFSAWADSFLATTCRGLSPMCVLPFQTLALPHTCMYHHICTHYTSSAIMLPLFARTFRGGVSKEGSIGHPLFPGVFRGMKHAETLLFSYYYDIIL